MKILLLSERHHKFGSTSISPFFLASVLLCLIAGISASASWLAYNMGHEEGVEQGIEDSRLASISGTTIQSSISQQRKEWEETKKRTREHLNAMALKLGQLQSHIVRLNALGERLTKMGKLDAEEFDFKKTPPQGGLERNVEKYAELSELVDDMEALSRVIEDRELKLNLMEDLILNSDLQKEVQPSGYPVKGGYISSKYGERTDPFTGARSYHDGVDLAGRVGADVTAAASGIVIYAGKKHGYGKVIKLHHGNGIVTLYAHNNKLLAEVGDYVTKGQRIATVGSTGRSTGPHVHFEVQLNGKTVDPEKYLHASR